MKKNYQIELEKEIEKIEGTAPTLLLHSCCAPCSSYVLEYLSKFFRITVLYYNPNIYPPQEFFKRRDEQERFIKSIKTTHPVSFVGCEYDDDKFYQSIKGFENEQEGGERCFLCYRLRLSEAAEYAKKEGFDYFTTTLSISPHKNSQILNQIGLDIQSEYGVKYLLSDFKKKNGYKRSCEISAEYGMYRQDYCGCVFSMRESHQRKEK